MKQKTKRPYKKSGKYVKRTQESVQSNSTPLSGESSIILLPDILKSIELLCKHRKDKGLPDDREERLERAIRYQEFIKDKVKSCQNHQ